MKALFPHGLHLETEDDFNRFAIFDTVIMKLQRYAQQFLDGGHLDSSHDAIIYLAMMVEIDENRNITQTSERRISPDAFPGPTK